MHNAVAFNEPNVVRFLIENFNFDVNCRSSMAQTALMLACLKGYAGLVKYLLKKGADISMTDQTGFTALLYAVKAGHVGISLYLI